MTIDALPPLWEQTLYCAKCGTQLLWNRCYRCQPFIGLDGYYAQRVAEENFRQALEQLGLV